MNVIAPIFTSPTGMFLQAIYFPIQLFAANSFGNALELFVDGPTYATKRSAATPVLDVSAAYDRGTLVLNAVNRSRTESLPVTFELEDKQFSGDWQVAEVNGPDIKSENNFGSMPVKTTTKSAQASGARFRYELPPHSYTMLKGKLA